MIVGQNKIQWINGCQYAGKIKEGKPEGVGKYVNAKGLQGKVIIDSIIKNDNEYYDEYEYQYFVLMDNSKVFGELNIQTGEFQRKTSPIFKQINDLKFNGYGTEITKESDLFRCHFQDKQIIQGLLNSGRKAITYQRKCHFNVNGMLTDFQSEKMKVDPYRLIFNSKDQYIMQYSQQQSGTIMWNCGSIYSGGIKNNQFASVGIFIDQNGNKASTCNGFAYFITLGKYGKLDVISGSVALNQNATITFSNNDDCKQNGWDGNSSGTIRWQNGCSCKCRISENQPRGVGEYTDSNGKLGLYYYTMVYMYESGKFGIEWT